MVSTHVYMCMCKRSASGPGQWTTKHSIVCSTGFHVKGAEQLTTRTILFPSVCKCAHVRVRRRVAVELRGLLSSLQLINRVITFCLQQMWDTPQKIHFGVISLELTEGLRCILTFEKWNMEKKKLYLAAPNATIWGVVVKYKLALAKNVLLSLPLSPGLCHCLVD